MNKSQIFLRKHSSTILTTIGAAGVIATSVLAVKATPKALYLLEEAKKEKNDELTVMETVKIAWKPYIPAAITGVSTIACIFGANYLNKRQQASLISAYALLDNSFKQYREKTKELYTEESTNVEHEIIKSNFDNTMKIKEDNELFFDYQSMRYFESTIEEVKHAEYIINQKLSKEGYACLNDLYEILGLDFVPYGYDLGWSTVINDDPYIYDLEFDFEKVEMDDGLECNIITLTCPPSLNYMC